MAETKTLFTASVENGAVVFAEMPADRCLVRQDGHYYGRLTGRRYFCTRTEAARQAYEDERIWLQNLRRRYEQQRDEGQARMALLDAWSDS